jgi:hypothetical protein
MTPVVLEVVAPMLSSMGLTCRGCGFVFKELGFQKTYRDACSNEYPEHWKDAAVQLSQWIRKLSSLYKHRILIEVIDAQSPLGLWKQIRHRLFSMPAFIVDRKLTCTGWNVEQLESIIDSRIRELCNRVDDDQCRALLR